MSNTSYEKYFVYSKEQHDMMKDIAKTQNRTLILGEVVVRGVSKQYTDILNDMDKCKYADSTPLIRADIRKIKYSKHKKV